MDVLTNEDRKRKALEALCAHQDPQVTEGWETRFIDLLTDLRHFADAEEVDFHAALDTSYEHYLEERS